MSVHSEMARTSARKWNGMFGPSGYSFDADGMEIAVTRNGMTRWIIKRDAFWAIYDSEGEEQLSGLCLAPDQLLNDLVSLAAGDTPALPVKSGWMSVSRPSAGSWA